MAVAPRHREIALRRGEGERQHRLPQPEEDRQRHRHYRKRCRNSGQHAGEGAERVEYAEQQRVERFALRRIADPACGRADPAMQRPGNRRQDKTDGEAEYCGTPLAAGWAY